MRRFLLRFLDKITGVLEGFDRLVFRGWLRPFCHEVGMSRFLEAQDVQMKDFEPFAKGVTHLLNDAADHSARAAGGKVEYLMSSSVSKEMVARNLLVDRPIRHGPICVLSVVEPCWTWQVRRDRERKVPQHFRRVQGKCKHYYHYFLDPRFDFMHVRVQTWFPFQVRVCINGRGWLGRRLDEHRLRYRRADNCFPWIASPERAQRLMDDMVDLPWPDILDDIVVTANPMLATLMDQLHQRFYWTVWQSEWATDVMFKNAEALDSCFPAFVRHAMSTFKSEDVMRFLGRKLVGQYRGEVTTDHKRRVEGVRVKHFADDNSVKMYNKQGSVLRVETTITNPGAFKVCRRAQGDPTSERCLRPLRKGVVDIKRLAKAAGACNDRYGEALADVAVDTPLGRILDPITKPAQIGGRRVRAMRPWADPDLPLLAEIGRAEFMLNGFRNRDLAPLLFPEQLEGPNKRKAAAKVTLRLRLLRAHGIIEKVAGTHRYLVTARGRTIITAVIAARDASLSTLQQCA